MHSFERADTVEEVQQSLVTMKDVVVAQWVKIAFALEAAGEASEGGSAFDNGDAKPCLGQGIRRRAAGQSRRPAR